MNPFIVQCFTPTEGNQFHNKPLMAYPQPSQNRYFSPVARNNMLRYPYDTVALYSFHQPQNSEPLPSGLNLIGQNSPSPVNVFNGKVNVLAESLHQTNLNIEQNEMTEKMQLPTADRETLVQNFTKTSFVSDTSRKRLLHTFNKNFHLLRPGVLDVHDHKRKKITSDEELVARNSLSLLDAKGNKCKKPKFEANETNRCVNNPNAMKKNEAQARSKNVMIREDENGFLTVCYEPLLESSDLREESISNTLIGGSDTKSSLVNKDDEPDELDLTLHL